MKTRRALLRKPLGILVVAGLGLVSACGSSGSSSTTAASSASKLSGSKIVFGVIASEGGTGITKTADISTTAKNWQDYMNAHNGIGGHPVSVIVKNDRGNAASALQIAQDLIKNDHAIAIGDASFAAAGFQKYVDGANVPVISLNGSTASFLYVTDKNFFANMTTIPAAAYAFVKTAQIAGGTNFGLLYCAEAAACAQSVPLFKADAQAVGMKFGYSAAIGAATPNFTAVCLAAKNAGVDSLAVVTADPQANQRLFDNCATQDYKPIVLNGGSNLPQAAKDDPKIPVQWLWSPTLPYFVKTAATAPFRQAMGEYLPSATVQQKVMNVWVGLEVFAAAAKAGVKAGGTLTASSIYEGLYSFDGFTAGGLTGPLTYKRSQPNQANCFFVSKMDHGVSSTPKGTAPVCAVGAAGQK